MSSIGPLEDDAFALGLSGPTTPGAFAELRRRFLKDRVALTAVVFIVLTVLVAIFAPLLAPFDPKTIPLGGELNGSPSWSHLLGTDVLGRDILSRLLFGARSSMTAAFVIVSLALVVALPIGLVSGYLSGRVDTLIMRLMEVLFTFPPIVFALTVSAMLGPSLIHASLAISVVFVPSFVRLIRGQVLSVREELYIEASRASGLGPARIITRHVLPNVASPIVVQSALSFGFAVLAEAGLSFLGFGASLGTPSWGNMLSDAFTRVLDKPWPLIPPGLAIFLTVLAFNLVGDGLRDALGRERFRPTP